MNKQQGTLLIELGLVLVLLIMMSTGVGAWLKYKAEQQKIEHLAHWMLSVQRGVQRYLDANGVHLLQHDTVTQIEGFIDEWRPTVNELVVAQYLAADSVVNSHVEIHIQPAGCGPDMCHLDAVIAYTKPLLTRAGHIDLDAAAHWLIHTQAKGYVVYEKTPQWLTGAARRLANPLLGQAQPFQVGTIAVLSSTDNSDSLYLTLRERRNPSFQADVDIEGYVQAKGDVRSGRYFYLPSLGEPQMQCATEDAISRKEKQLLLCQNGVWVQLSNYSLTDPQHIKAFFEAVLGLETESLPLASGGYYGMSRGGYGYPACWLLNPLTKFCACPQGTTGARVGGAIHLETYYSGSNFPDTRSISLYGCMGS